MVVNEGWAEMISTAVRPDARQLYALAAIQAAAAVVLARLGRAEAALQMLARVPAALDRALAWAPNYPSIIAYDNRDRLYVLQASTTPGSFLADPGEGSIVRLEPSGTMTPIVSGLDYPASITFGPDGDLYVTNNGFSLVSNGNGTILRIRIGR
jgi:DNA-binding beta-propeller fold protein YncE